MNLSVSEGIEKKTFVVIGGLGFVGSALCLELVRRGAQQVRAFDVRPQSPWSHDLRNRGVHCIQGDVVRKEDVVKALSGADCVFHLASFGMSGKDMLQFGRVDEINISGTSHVLDACLEHGISRLVYVSTYDVVFGGKEIVNGNEALPYFPLDDHLDAYGKSKSIAEQLVLKSNSQPFKNEKGKLYTCAIRPAAVYGPGEETRVHRIIKLAKFGLLPFKIGTPNVKTDWVYVDNLVSALLLASTGLSDDIPERLGQAVAAGQPYFVSDGYPVNSFEFFRPLLKSLDYDLPKLSLAVPHALLLANLSSAFYSLLRWPQPLILPAEVYKVGITHYFSFAKAREELGYTPTVSPQDGMAATIAYWKERKRRSLDSPGTLTSLSVVTVLGSLFCAAFMPDHIGPVPQLRAFFLSFFRSTWLLKGAALSILATHVYEGFYAWKLAKKVDPQNAIAWGSQTFVLGFFSLRLLEKRAKTQ